MKASKCCYCLFNTKFKLKSNLKYSKNIKKKSKVENNNNNIKKQLNLKSTSYDKFQVLNNKLLLKLLLSLLSSLLIFNTKNKSKFNLKSKTLLFLMTIILSLSSTAFAWLVDFNNPVVHTQYGSISGKIDERKTRFNRRPICSFLSIPYARPPIGANRFLRPLEPDSWQNYDATQKRVMCMQIEQRFRISVSLSNPIVESEDCLYLNVFVPADRATPVINYPVIVYAHGGEFKHGSKDHYSPEYLLDHGIILVTINYRLGVFGFLSTNDNAAPGNLGLYDQIAALRWVRKNIQSFGGNNDDITLMGHDAGAISAALLLLAPHETQGLIHKVIAVGGSAFSPAAFQWNPARQAIEFARALNCNDKRTDKLVNCLRETDASSLVSVSRQSHDFERNSFRFWFRPVIDKNSTESLIRDFPHLLYARRNFLKVPLMAGLSTSEGSLEFFLNWHQLRSMSSLERIQFLISPYLYEFARAEILATTLEYQYVKRLNMSGFSLTSGSQFGGSNNGNKLALNSEPVVLATRLTSQSGSMFWQQQNLANERNHYDAYISPNDFRSRQIARQVDAIGDFLYSAPLIKQLELHSEVVTQSYLFIFDYKGGKSFGHIQLNPYGRALASDGEVLTNGWLPSTPTSSGALLSTETSNFGVTHNDDLFYVLPSDYSPHIGDLRMHANGLTGQVAYSAIASIESVDGSTSALSGEHSSNDDNVIRGYVTYLTAFATRVNEHNAVANNLANWLPFRTTDKNYLRFTEQVPALYKNFHQSDVGFVNELVEPLEDLVNTPLPPFAYEELRDWRVATFSLALLLALLLASLLVTLCALTIVRRAANKRRRRREALNLSVASNLPVAVHLREQRELQKKQQQQQQQKQQQLQHSNNALSVHFDDEVEQQQRFASQATGGSTARQPQFQSSASGMRQHSVATANNISNNNNSSSDAANCSSECSCEYCCPTHANANSNSNFNSNAGRQEEDDGAAKLPQQQKPILVTTSLSRTPSTTSLAALLRADQQQRQQQQQQQRARSQQRLQLRSSEVSSGRLSRLSQHFE